MREHGARIIGAAILITLGGCIHTGDASFVEEAGAERPYDYVVNVRNTFDYGYNPEVSEDRVRLARQSSSPIAEIARLFARINSLPMSQE